MASSAAGPVAGTYTKITGFATTEGQMFEVKISALLYLKGLNSGRPFQLASNVEGVGAFDDIVFRSLTLGDDGDSWITYFFQIKHKIRADITSHALTAPTGNFALVKYYESFLKTRQTLVAGDRGEIFSGKFKDCHFVILTNAHASKELWKHEITDASADVDEVVRFGREEFIFRLGGCRNIVSCLAGKDLATDFLNKLKIFSREPRVTEMDDLISDEILKSHRFTASQAKRIGEIFVEEFQGWCGESNVILDENSDILNRAISKHKIEVIQPTQYERLSLELTFNRSSVQNIEKAVSERCSLLHIITAEHMIEVSCSKLLQALRDAKDPFILTSLECFLREKDAFLSVWENLLVIAADVTPGNPVGSDVMDDLCKFLKKDTNKRVVFLSSVDNELVEGLKKQLGDLSKTVRDSFHLNQLTLETLENNLKTKISFQGREVEKRVLVGGTLNSFQALSSYISSFVVKNVSEQVGQALPESLDVFIPRTLHRRNYIKKSIFKSHGLNGKFAISGVTEGDLLRLIPHDDMKLSPNKDDIDHHVRVKSSRESQFLVLSPENAEGNFNQLCKVHPNVYWLHMEDDQLTWERSHGSVGDILEYIDEDRYSVYNPSTMLETTDRIVLLVAEPGMGKTTLLTHLARQTKEENPADWIVFISLNDHAELLDDSLCKCFKASEFLSSVIKTTPVDKALFEHNLANNNNVVVFLDGVDELSESCLENFKLLLTHFVTASNVKKIWVASRHFRGHMFENFLSTISFSLQMFTLDDQKHFFKTCWRDVETTLSKPQREALISKILTLVSSSIGEKERQFTGVPLQTKMLADIFEDYYRNKNNNNLPEKLNLLMMYEMFVETKYRITFEKNNFLIHKHKKAFRNYCKQSNEEHMAAALVVTLDNNSLQMLHDKNVKTVSEKFIHDVMSGEEKTGIVDREVNGMPHFVHKMFSEFYAGIWLAENYQNNRSLLETHFCREEFRVIRNIFDRKLSRENPLHTAVLNGDTSQVKHLLKSGTDVNSVDLGGRTALHFAAAVGFHDSSESKVNLTIVSTLLDYGADVERYDTAVLKWSPLRYADETKAFDIVDLMLRNGNANHDIKVTKKLIEDHLHLNAIIKNGFLSLMEFLLDNGLDANAKLNNKNRSSLLHKAAEYGDENLSKLLIKHGAAITSLDHSNRTPLHNSADNGHLSVARILLKNVSDDRDAIAQYANAPTTLKDTAVHCAAQRGHLDVMRLLVSVGGDFDARGWKGCTPLHVASFNGHLATSRFLLDNVSEDGDAIARYVNARDTDSNTAVHYAARGGHVDVMRTLVGAGGDLDAHGWMGSTPLHVAVFIGHLSVARFLLDNISEDREEIARYVNARRTDNNTSMHWAARGGHVDIVRLLFGAGGELAARGGKRRTPLHWAALYSHLSVVRFLLANVSSDRDANARCANAHDADEDTATHYAAERGHVDIIRLLVSAGGDLETRGCNGSTPLHVASSNGHLSVVRFLLDNVSEDRDAIARYANARDADEDTAMHSAASKGHVDVMRLLFSVGGEIETRGVLGLTPLHMAAFNGHLAVAHFLLEKISDDQDAIARYVNARNADGNTAMYYAAHGGHVNFMRLLVSLGGDLEAHGLQGFTFLHMAAFNGHLSVCQFLLENISEDPDTIAQYVNARRTDYNTAMHCAARGGHLDIMRLLFSVGGDLEARGWKNSTPLHRAALRGHLPVARFLLENVSDDRDAIARYVNARNSYGRTAMHWAARGGYVDFVRLLLSAGGDIAARDDDGSTSLNLAAEYGRPLVVDLVLDKLRAAGVPLVDHIDACDSEGDSAVVNAARRGHSGIVRTLADNGAALILANSRGETSLHVAALHGHLSTVEVLVDGCVGNTGAATAFLDARDSQGETALATALRRGHSDIARLLTARRDLDRGRSFDRSWWRQTWLRLKAGSRPRSRKGGLGLSETGTCEHQA